MSLSIIIPTLNEELYIGKLLDCLVNQTYKDFEVIIVDGGSKDKTIREVKKYKKKLGLKILKANKKNVSLQRNLGASNSKDNLLAFFDADITFNGNFLENSLRQINKKKLKLASARIKPDIHYWYYDFFFNSINVVMYVTQYLSLAGFGACLFIQKELFNKIHGFNELFYFAEDHDLIKRASKYEKIRILRQDFFHSVRRFEIQGTKRTMALWFKGTFYFLTNDLKKLNKNISTKY